ncbi:MAG: LapA family protein [Bacteroidota bacterium]|nr:LapA family protein [Bacteroidota bacterium]
MKIFKTIVLILLLAIILTFTIQNIELAKFKFLNWSIEIPLSVASIVIYVLGAATGGLLFSLLRKVISPSKKEKAEKPDKVENEY